MVSMRTKDLNQYIFSVFAFNPTVKQPQRSTSFVVSLEGNYVRKENQIILGSDNYFHWEFRMSMPLERKGLLAHVQYVKDLLDVNEGWLLNDMKAHSPKDCIRAPRQNSVGNLGSSCVEYAQGLLHLGDAAPTVYSWFVVFMTSRWKTEWRYPSTSTVLMNW